MSQYFGFNTTQINTLRALGIDADAITELQTSVANLNTWAAALATKLNADAGVTDVNYDTNPQA